MEDSFEELKNQENGHSEGNEGKRNMFTMQKQTGVTAYLERKQLLLVVITDYRIVGKRWIDSTLKLLN